MKAFLKKSSLVLLLSLSIFSFDIFSTATLASFSHDSYARWVGVGGRADVTAITSQINEPRYYHLVAIAAMDNGERKMVSKNPASATDRAVSQFRTKGAVSGGRSDHEWIAFGYDRLRNKVINIR